jgi:hypothetical protein
MLNYNKLLELRIQMASIGYDRPSYSSPAENYTITFLPPPKKKDKNQKVKVEIKDVSDGKL